jgi:hypothetical protein
MQQRMIFGLGVKPWIKQRVKRWVKLFNLNDWVIRLYLADEEKLGKYEDTGIVIDAFNRVTVPYRTSVIHLGEHLGDTDLGHAILFHEIRHIVYEPLSNEIDKLIDEYVPEERRKHVRKSFVDSIESLIEQDVYAFEQLTDL